MNHHRINPQRLPQGCRSNIIIFLSQPVWNFREYYLAKVIRTAGFSIRQKAQSSCHLKLPWFHHHDDASTLVAGSSASVKDRSPSFMIEQWQALQLTHHFQQDTLTNYVNYYKRGITILAEHWAEEGKHSVTEVPLHVCVFCGDIMYTARTMGAALCAPLWYQCQIWIRLHSWLMSLSSVGTLQPVSHCADIVNKLRAGGASGAFAILENAPYTCTILDALTTTADAGTANGWPGNSQLLVVN